MWLLRLTPSSMRVVLSRVEGETALTPRFLPALALSVICVVTEASSQTLTRAASPPTQKPLPATRPVASTDLAAVTREIAAVRDEITRAEADDAKYSGGLVKAIVGLRLATLRQTLAMLEQRRAASDLNIALRYTVDGKPFVPPSDAAGQLATVEKEIASTRLRIAAAENEVAKYSGGLVLSMALTTLATARQTEAMLDQRRIALTFQLPQFAGLQSDAKASSTSASPALPDVRLLEITDSDARVTERNDTWWKFAWKVTVKNMSASAVVVRATMEFLDKDGFIVDTDDGDGMVVPPNGQETASGFALITMPSATTVAKTAAKVRRVQ